MSPAWLPPLNSHAEYITAVRMEEAEIPLFCKCIELCECKEGEGEVEVEVEVEGEGEEEGRETSYLYIELKCTVRFFPMNYEKFELFDDTDDNIAFPALLLDQWFEVKVESNRRGDLLQNCEGVKGLIKNLLAYLNIFWKLYPIRVLEEEDSYNYVLEDEYGLMQKITSALAAKDTNWTETGFTPLCLHIFKHVSISVDEYYSWVTWILEKTRNDSNFINEYIKSIRRRRTIDEIFYEDEMKKVKSTSGWFIMELEDTQNFDFDGRKNCIICLCNLCVESVSKLPCSHVFHKRCIIRWLRKSHMCPLCRSTFPISLST